MCNIFLILCNVFPIWDIYFNIYKFILTIFYYTYHSFSYSYFLLSSCTYKIYLNCSSKFLICYSYNYVYYSYIFHHCFSVYIGFFFFLIIYFMCLTSLNPWWFFLEARHCECCDWMLKFLYIFKYLKILFLTHLISWKQLDSFEVCYARWIHDSIVLTRPHYWDNSSWDSTQFHVHLKAL